jgi:hypothetical protein
MTRRQVTHHLYADDGTRDHQDQGRCLHCGCPASNERHGLPDRRAEMDEHRRRAGDGDDE